MAPTYMHGGLTQSLATRAAEAAAVADTPYEGAFARAARSGELQIRQPLHVLREDDEEEFKMRIKIKEARVRKRQARRVERKRRKEARRAAAMARELPGNGQDML